MKAAAKPAGRGRPGKRDEALEQQLCDALRSGVPIRLACDFVGIAESTYFAWQQQFPEFSERVRRARATVAVQNLALIQTAGKTDWRAAEAALKLAFPDQFGQRLTIQGEQRAELIQHLVEELTRALESSIPDPRVRQRVALAVIQGGLGQMGAPAGA